MIFELVRDFGEALTGLPEAHPRRRILSLLDEAVRRDVHFLDRHPTALFQCLWNSCWWYDCSEAAEQYDPPDTGRSPPNGGQPPPWERPGAKLCELLTTWHAAAVAARPGLPWLRSLRAPAAPLGSTLRAVLRGHNDWIYGLSYSPDGRSIASASKDKTVRTWYADTGMELLCLRGHDGEGGSVAYSPNGRCFASGAKDKTVRIWDAESGQERLCLRGHEGDVKSVALSPDGRWVASGSSDKTVRLWDADTGQPLRVIHGHRGIYCVAFSPDGRRIIGGCAGPPSIQVWDAESGQELHSLHADFTDEMRALGAHGAGVLCAAFAPDGRRIVSGDQNGDVRLWDAETGSEEWVRNSTSGAVHSVAFSPDGRRIAFGTARPWGSFKEGSLCVWDIQGAKPLFRLGQDEGILAVAWSPDGRRLVIGGRALDCAAMVVESESPSKPPHLHGHGGRINWIDFAPDGRRFATASDDSTVRIWDAQTGRELRCVRGHERGVGSVRYAPDGRRIATGGNSDKTVRIWDAETGEELLKLSDHFGLVSVAFSPDGSRLASDGPNSLSVYVWDADARVRLEVVFPKVHGVARRCVDATGNRPEQTDPDLDPSDVLGWFGTRANSPPHPTFDWSWEARRQTQESAIQLAGTGEVVAWFPVALGVIPTGHVTRAPLGNAWAGSLRNDVYVLKLEGGGGPP